MRLNLKAAAGACLALGFSGWPRVVATEGVVVVSVDPVYEAARAGLRPGDVVRAWSRAAHPPANPEPAEGAVRSWFDILDAEVDQGPRGTVSLRIERDGAPLSTDLGPSAWGLETRPGSEDTDQARECWRAQQASQPNRAVALAVAAGRPAAAAGLAIRNARTLAVAGEDSQPLLLEALESVAALAPGGLAVAHIEERFAWIANGTADPAVIVPHAQTAFDITAAQAPGSALMAGALEQLGIAAEFASESARAERFLTQSLQLREALVPESFEVGRALTALGGNAWARGDLDAAEAFHRRALAINIRLRPGSRSHAFSLMQLGFMHVLRFDDESAMDLLTKAAEMLEREAPNSSGLAAALNALGEIATRAGRYEEARGFLTRALRSWEDRAPDALSTTEVMNSLARAYQRSGDLQGARSLLLSGIEKARRVTTDGVQQGLLENTLGSVLTEMGDLASARATLEHAVALWARRSPGTTDEAMALHQLGEVRRLQGDVAAASTLFGQAMDALDIQGSRLGASEDGASLWTREFGGYYRDQIDALVSLGRPREAWLASERYRAQALRTRLAQRVVPSADVPPELEAERARLERRLDEVQARLRDLPNEDHDQAAGLLAELRGLRHEHALATERIRRASPGQAFFQHPEALDFQAAMRNADEGTLVLAYSVGRERTILLAADPRGGRIEAFVLPVGDASLRERTARFHHSVEAAEDGGATREQSAALFDLLLSPCLPALRSAQRVLVLPDGPLHEMPFGALLPSGKARRFLAEWKPIHVAPSFSLYAELRRGRTRSPAFSVVAFGDPTYPVISDGAVGASMDPVLEREIRRGRTLQSLPASRREVEAIARLFPTTSTVYLGAEATEERVKSLAPDVHYVHFACHGLLNQRTPRDSALALTIREHPLEGQDNGLLQAREIASRVHLGAELVTLSACESGLGAERGGEGLVGLTQAFLTAGARSVLASLWAVSDDSTADLMTEFYRNLRDGKSKDRALQAAQVAMIRRGAKPFHWAAFQLTGDWR